MAQRVYSTQFIAANDSASYVYVCPDGYTALVSCVDVYIGIVTEGGNFTLEHEASVVAWSQGYDVPGEQYSAWRGKIVLLPGHAIAITAGDTFACSASGDLFLNPPA